MFSVYHQAGSDFSWEIGSISLFDESDVEKKISPISENPYCQPEITCSAFGRTCTLYVSWIHKGLAKAYYSEKSLEGTSDALEGGAMN
jgi:hypothetical protein